MIILSAIAEKYGIKMLEKMSIVCRWIQNEGSIGDKIVQRQKSFETERKFPD